MIPEIANNRHMALHAQLLTQRIFAEEGPDAIVQAHLQALAEHPIVWDSFGPRLARELAREAAQRIVTTQTFSSHLHPLLRALVLLPLPLFVDGLRDVVDRLSPAIRDGHLPPLSACEVQISGALALNRATTPEHLKAWIMREVAEDAWALNLTQHWTATGTTPPVGPELG